MVDRESFIPQTFFKQSMKSTCCFFVCGFLFVAIDIERRKNRLLKFLCARY